MMAFPAQDDRKRKRKDDEHFLCQEVSKDGFGEGGGRKRKHELKPRREEAAVEAAETGEPRGKDNSKKKGKETMKRRPLWQQDIAGEEEEERGNLKQKVRQQERPRAKDERKKKKQKERKEMQREQPEEVMGDTTTGDKKHKDKYRRSKRSWVAKGQGDPAGRRRSLIEDSRFASAHSDPRFQRLPRRESKVSIDSRFSRMFSDKSFAASSSLVDKRGKPRKEKAENPLLHYYLPEESPAVEEEDGEEDNRMPASDDVSETSTSEGEGSDGPGADPDTTSSTDEEGDEKESDQYAGNSAGYRFWMANEEDTPTIENETCRLAVVNMDWDHIKAVDLYVVMSGELSSNGGRVISVAVYPSDYGLKCMEIEARRGPHVLFDDDDDDGDDDDNNGGDDDTDDESVNEKIRSYQLKRLKYYYAVVECDSTATASRLYNRLDGVELLQTANVLDLRFIPDSMEFKHPPRDIATEAPADYDQPYFETTALQHSTVKLTWDNDEPDRKKILRRKFNPDQMDELEQYLASDDSDNEDDENNENHGDKYHALLQSAAASGTDEDSDSGKEMEVTFLPGVENLSKHLDKNKLKKSEEGVWEAYLRKRHEKKKARKQNSKLSSDDNSSDSEYDEPPQQPDDFFEEPLDSDTKDGKKGSKKDSLQSSNKNSQKDRRRPPENGTEETREASRAELELLLANDDDEHLKGFNLRPKKAKGKKGKEVHTEDKLPDVDAISDPRFSSRLTSHLYALDPTDPQYKRSASGIRQAHAQKQRKGNVRALAAEEEEQICRPMDDEKPLKEKHEIMSLVRSLKLKSKVLGKGGKDVAED